MRPHPVNRGIWRMLSKIKKMEQRLRAAGLPMLLARLPYWLLALQYCCTMQAKMARIERIAVRIRSWLASVQELCAREEARTELLDVRQAMRDDIECTKRTLWDLREICLDVTQLFGNVGYSSRRLARLQENLVKLLSESYESATQLQQVLAEHDAAALALLRDMQAPQWQHAAPNA
ncbi:hypothetical protein ASD15_07365 [Massilia sp. Root351]|jgi:hypothetical protein|uniref:hypothetical protein n=1 Tax=Massilia sp. Root351 TaxID=1736522 RepID=UPI00070F9F07|nr:hypothetical protein [Massilia sp. Root351]KQV84948.1 hypothetical protein ASD15_07365 [Massilia sp. Root351]